MSAVYYIVFCWLYLVLLCKKIMAVWRCDYDWLANKSFFATNFIMYPIINGKTCNKLIYLSYKHYTYGKGWVWHMPVIMYSLTHPLTYKKSISNDPPIKYNETRYSS